MKKLKELYGDASSNNKEKQEGNYQNKSDYNSY